MSYSAVGTSVTGGAPPLWTGTVPGGTTAWGTPPPTSSTATKPAESKPSGGGGFWDTLKSALVGGATAYGAGLAQKGQQPGMQYMPQPQSPIEKYLPWIVIGGTVIVVAVVLKKKK